MSRPSPEERSKIVNSFANFLKSKNVSDLYINSSYLDSKDLSGERELFFQSLFKSFGERKMRIGFLLPEHSRKKDDNADIKLCRHIVNFSDSLYRSSFIGFIHLKTNHLRGDEIIQNKIKIFNQESRGIIFVYDKDMEILAESLSADPDSHVKIFCNDAHKRMSCVWKKSFQFRGLRKNSWQSAARKFFFCARNALINFNAAKGVSGCTSRSG